MPVLAHAAGGARIYVDKTADLKQAMKIITNAKISKPAACNAIDTVLVHQDIAIQFLPRLVKQLQAFAVVLKGDAYASKLTGIQKATVDDWQKEFLGLTMAIKVVRNIEEAIAFIAEYGKKHSEGIIAKDKKIIAAFVNTVDAASVFVNCSTRFHDGYEYDIGAEMGIATGKLHARGPVGLSELSTYKWVADGNGQIRE